MAPVSVRSLIVAALLERLGDVTTGNGYATTFGSLFQGQVPELGPDDAHAVASVLMGDDTAEHAGPGLRVTAEAVITVVVKADDPQGNPWVELEAALGDVKQAIEIEEADKVRRRLGGLLEQPMRRLGTTIAPRPAGAQDVGLQLTYQVQFKEQWGGRQG